MKLEPTSRAKLTPAVALIAMLVALNVAWWGYLQTLPEHDTLWNFLFNLAYGSLFFFGGIFVLTRFRRGLAGQSVTELLGVPQLAVSHLAFSTALFIWTYYNLFGAVDVPFPSWADVFYVMADVSAVLGLSLLLSPRTSPVSRLWRESVALSLLMFLISATAVMVGLPRLGEAADAILLYFYILSSVVIIALIAVHLTRARLALLRGFLLRFGAAALFILLGDTAFAIREQAGLYWNGDVVDGLYMLAGCVALTLGFLLPAQLGKQDRASRRVASTEGSETIPASGRPGWRTTGIPTLLVTGVALALAGAACLIVILPAILRQTFPLPYKIDFESRDRLYDTELGDFGPPTISQSTFDYALDSQTDDLVRVRGEFDVRTLDGERIFNASDRYDVDPVTGRIVDAAEYLFAPRFLRRNDFQFRYVSYAEPIHLAYVGTEALEGLRVYHYAADFSMDNTANFGWLVGDSGQGVRYQVHMEAWFEPVTGNLIKLEDSGDIELFDMDAGATIRPWNSYQNVQTESSIAYQAHRASISRSIILMLVSISALLLLSAIFAFSAHRRRAQNIDARALSPFFLDVIGPTLVVLGLSAAATLVGWQLARVYADDQRRNEFDVATTEYLTSVRDRVEDLADMLQTGVALHNASSSVERAEWASFVRSIDINTRYRGILGLGVARIFPSEDESAFEATIAADGLPGFQVFPETAGPERASIIYLEPYNATNALAVGFDLMSEPRRAAALSKARDLGLPVMTESIQLVQEGGGPPRQGALMVDPIYDKEKDITTVEGRRDAVVGFVSSPFRIDDLVGDIFQTKPWPINLAIYDGDSVAQDKLLFGQNPSAQRDLFRRTDTIILANRPWTFVFTELPGTIVASNTSLPTYTLTGGLGITLMLAVMTIALSSSRRRAQRLARIATAELADNQRRLQTLIDAVPVGIFWARMPDGEPIMVNDKAKALLGRGIEPGVKREAYGEVYAIMRADGSPYPVNELPLVQTLTSGRPAMKSDLFVHRPDGTVLALRAVSAVIPAAGLMPATAVAVFDDFTKEYELDRQKTEFISITSHQLRTPLASIRWFVEMLRDGDLGKLNPAQQEHIDMVYESNSRLITIVNDLLNVSRIDAGSVEVVPVETDLVELSVGVTAELAPLAAERKIRVIEAYAEGMPKIKVDAKLIRQVFVNLFSNAIKYTPESGTVTISSEVTPDEVRFSVKDSGIGIPRDQQKHIFGKFFRAENARSSEADGSGLGLYVCKSIIELSGGRIWFESAEGRGSTFSFSLPRKGSPVRKGGKTLV